MSADPIENMRGRAAQCRRLATQILDEQATQALLQMAAAIDLDILMLEAERKERPKPIPPAS